MNIKTASRILNLFFRNVTRENKKRVIISFFGGEPLLNFETLEFAVCKTKKFSKKTGIKSKFKIITNGTLFHEKMSKLFSKNSLVYTQITLDGDKKLNDKRRPLLNESISSFNLIYENIPKFMKISKKVVIRINLDNSNIDSIEEFIKNKLSKFSNKNLFVNLGIITNFNGRGKGYNTGGYKELVSKIPSVIKLLYRMKLIKGEPQFLRFNQSLCAANKIKPHWYDPSGRIYCCEREVGSSLDIGNIYLGLDKKKKELWKKLTLLNNKKCLTCSKLFFCGGPCPDDYYYGKKEEPACYIFDDLMKIYVNQIIKEKELLKLSKYTSKACLF